MHIAYSIYIKLGGYSNKTMCNAIVRHMAKSLDSVTLIWYDLIVAEIA